LIVFIDNERNEHLAMNHILHFPSPHYASELYGQQMAHLNYLEKQFHVHLIARDNWIEVKGEADCIAFIQQVFDYLEKAKKNGFHIQLSDITRIAEAIEAHKQADLDRFFDQPLILRIKNRNVIAKNLNQKRYIQGILKKDIIFGIGPAGTGKTYLAVAAALDLLFQGKINKLILTRPAVESGEALGFLPGDLEQKILPYLRPLYDSIEQIIGREDCARLMGKAAIEIAPLAYMRGRTLSDACIILDEAQNTTHEQMMMFLTRLGENSRMVITGDITQIDLPPHKTSGLKEAIRILKSIDDILFFHFEPSDVVRHPLVQHIIHAYQQDLAQQR